MARLYEVTNELKGLSLLKVMNILIEAGFEVIASALPYSVDVASCEHIPKFRGDSSEHDWSTDPYFLCQSRMLVMGDYIPRGMTGVVLGHQRNVVILASVPMSDEIQYSLSFFEPDSNDALGKILNAVVTGVLTWATNGVYGYVKKYLDAEDLKLEKLNKPIDVDVPDSAEVLMQPVAEGLLPPGQTEIVLIPPRLEDYQIVDEPAIEDIIPDRPVITPVDDYVTREPSKSWWWIAAGVGAAMWLGF